MSKNRTGKEQPKAVRSVGTLGVKAVDAVFGTGFARIILPPVQYWPSELHQMAAKAITQLPGNQQYMAYHIEGNPDDDTQTMSFFRGSNDTTVSDKAWHGVLCELFGYTPKSNKPGKGKKGRAGRKNKVDEGNNKGIEIPIDVVAGPDGQPVRVTVTPDLPFGDTDPIAPSKSDAKFPSHLVGKRHDRKSDVPPTKTDSGKKRPNLGDIGFGDKQGSTPDTAGTQQEYDLTETLQGVGINPNGKRVIVTVGASASSHLRIVAE